jgi:hypothetical protein
MTDFTPMAAGAAASLSMADTNFDGVKHHDIDEVDATNKTLTWVVIVVTALGITAGLVAMLVEASIIAYVAFAFSLFTAPYIIHQRRNLEWLPSKLLLFFVLLRWSKERRNNKTITNKKRLFVCLFVRLFVCLRSHSVPRRVEQASFVGQRFGHGTNPFDQRKWSPRTSSQAVRTWDEFENEFENEKQRLVRS